LSWCCCLSLIRFHPQPRSLNKPEESNTVYQKAARPDGDYSLRAYTGYYTSSCWTA
jgi:hypothetical protein